MKSFLVVGVLLFLAAPTLATDGGKGGGNTEEGEFARYARSIYTRLAEHPSEARKVGISLNAFKKALKDNQVQCAFGKILEEMQKENKFAFFVPEDKSIYFVCSQWDEKKNLGTPTEILITHEYARAMGLENGNYDVSSNVPAIIDLPDKAGSSTLIAANNVTLAAHTSSTNIFKTGLNSCSLQHDARVYDRFFQKDSLFGIVSMMEFQKRRITIHELIEGIRNEVAGGAFIKESDFDSNMTWDEVRTVLRNKYFVDGTLAGDHWPILTDYQIGIQSWTWPGAYTLQCSLVRDGMGVGDFLDLLTFMPSSLLTPQRHFGRRSENGATKLHVPVSGYGFFVAEEKIPGKAVVNIFVAGAGMVKKIIQDDPDGTAIQIMYAYYLSLDKLATLRSKGIVIDTGGDTIEEVLQIDE